MMHPTFQKRCKILKLMAEFSFGTFMLNLECDELIFQLLQSFYTNITSDHPKNIKTSMQTIMSLFLEGYVDICKILRSNVLTIWRKELIVSPSTYDLGENFIMQNIKFLKRVLTKKELKMIDGGSMNKGIKTSTRIN